MADSRRTPATQVVALVNRIRQAPTKGELSVIRDEVRHLPVGDVDARMLQLGIASRERALQAVPAGAAECAVVAPHVAPPGDANVRKFVLSRAAPIKPCVSHLPRRVHVQRRTVVLASR